jgi:hypothetical protein
MKQVLRYAMLAMATLSGIAFLSGSSRLLATYRGYHRSAPSAVDPFDTLFAGVACIGFGRLYQLLGRARSDAVAATQTEIELAHVGFIFAWFSFIFMVHKMNLPQRSVSIWVITAFILATAIMIWCGFVVRKMLFKKSADALPGNVVEALRRWKGAHSIGFSNAISIAIFGAVLRFIGSSWYVAGIFFGLSLCLLLLWAPRQMASNTAQPA